MICVSLEIEALQRIVSPGDTGMLTSLTLLKLVLLKMCLNLHFTIEHRPPSKLLHGPWLALVVGWLALVVGCTGSWRKVH